MNVCMYLRKCLFFIGTDYETWFNNAKRCWSSRNRNREYSAAPLCTTVVPKQTPISSFPRPSGCRDGTSFPPPCHGRCVGVVDDAGRAFACSFLVVGGEFLAASPPTDTQQPTTTPVPEHLSAPPPPPPPPADTLPNAGAGSSSRVRSRLLRRVVLASGPVAPEGRGRGLCVLPPGLQSIGNPAAVHVVSLDDTTAACPDNLGGACVIHLTTTTTRAGEADEGSQAGAVGSQGAPMNQDREGAEEEQVPAGAGVTTGEGRNSGGLSASFGVVDGRGNEDGSDGVLGRASRELLAAAGVEEVGGPNHFFF